MRTSEASNHWINVADFRRYLVRSKSQIFSSSVGRSHDPKRFRDSRFSRFLFFWSRSSSYASAWGLHCGHERNLELPVEDPKRHLMVDYRKRVPGPPQEIVEKLILCQEWFWAVFTILTNLLKYDFADEKFVELWLTKSSKVFKRDLVDLWGWEDRTLGLL